jgi:moderate conductance mechanosensitive channel
MEQKFSNIWHEWHNYLVTWTRDRLPKLVIILLLAYVFARLLGVITRRIISFSEKRSPGSAIQAQQVRTVVGVLRSVGVFMIVFFAGMSLLEDVFNINIAPLLASAGIAGLAIGFGAQTLVKDMINGFFILVENQFQVGDVIRTSGVSGKVEQITMRRTVLRDVDGALHIIPNGSIQIVSNLNRDWSQVTLHVSVDYNENSDRVIALLKSVAKDVYADPDFASDLVAEPQVPGIERVRGLEVDYLLLAKVRPGRQHDVGRELRRRIKASFEANKIKAGVPIPVFSSEAPSAAK